MIVVHKKGGEYSDVINSYYDLERYSDGNRDKILVQGYSTSIDRALLGIYEDVPTRIYLNLEAPCAFASTDNCLEQQSYFTHVYTLCPYTCDFMNSHQSDTKFIPIPFPFRGECFKDVDIDLKPLDVIYMGTMMCQEHADIVESMKPYNYNYASLTPAGNPTMCNVSSQEKWNVLGKTKASIAINMCPLESRHIEWIKRNKHWESIETFNNLEYGYFPQFKPRVIEAMCTKTVNLVKRDPWNVIEKWFEEGKHFVYWDDITDLQEKLKDVVENYDKYESMVENAYERVYDFEIDKIYESMNEGALVI